MTVGDALDRHDCYHHPGDELCGRETEQGESIDDTRGSDASGGPRVPGIVADAVSDIHKECCE